MEKFNLKSKSGRKRNRTMFQTIWKILQLLLVCYLNEATAGSQDILMARRLSDSVVYDTTTDAPSACYCKLACFERPECTAHSRVVNTDGVIDCFYSNKIMLEWSLTEADVSAITIFGSGVCLSSLRSVNSCSFTSNGLTIPGVLTTQPTVQQETQMLMNYGLPEQIGTAEYVEATTCSSPFVEVGNVGCVNIVKDIKTWHQAKFNCEQMGAQFYSASSEMEYHALRTYLMNNPPGADTIWVAVKAGMWADGRSVTEWGRLSPNGDATECGKMITAYSYQYRLADDPCTLEFASVCKKIF